MGKRHRLDAPGWWGGLWREPKSLGPRERREQTKRHVSFKRLVVPREVTTDLPIWLEILEQVGTLQSHGRASSESGRRDKALTQAESERAWGRMMSLVLVLPEDQRPRALTFLEDAMLKGPETL